MAETKKTNKLIHKILTSNLKGFKTTLVTASTAALMLGGGNALGAAVANGVITVNNNANFSDAAAGGTNNWSSITDAGAAIGVPADPGGPQDNWAFTYGGDHAINANAANRTITAINVAGTAPGVLKVSQNTSIGSIITGGNAVPVLIIGANSLTLTGTEAVAANHGFDAAADTYDGLGVVTLNAGASTLTINTISGNKIILPAVATIDAGAAGVGSGVLTVNTPAQFDGAVGATKALKTANLNAIDTQFAALTAQSIVLGSTAKGGGFTPAAVTVGAVNGAIAFTQNTDGTASNATITLGGVLTGSIVSDFGGNVAGGQNVTGNVTLNPNAGNVAIGTAANVTVTGGVLNAGNIAGLVQVGGGNATVGDVGGAVTVTGGTLVNGGNVVGAVTVSGGNANIGNAAGQVTVSGGALTMGNATNAAQTLISGGDLTINTAVNGIKFTGAAIAGTTVNIVDGGNAGNVDNDAANGAGTGILAFVGDGNVGVIGNTETLNEVQFNGAAGKTVAVAGAAKANTFKIGAGKVTTAAAVEGDIQYIVAGIWEAANNIVGNIDFNGQDGLFQAADGVIIGQSVDSSVGVGNLGSLKFLGDGAVTLDIGDTKAIKVVEINGNNKLVQLQGNVNTQNLNFTQGAANPAGKVQIGGNLKAAVGFSTNPGVAGQAGILEFNDVAGTGDQIFSGTLGVGAASGQIIVNTPKLTATDISISEIGNVNILDNNIFVVDANIANVPDLLKVANQFSFVGANSQLVLYNSGTAGADRTITLNDNLSPVGNNGILALQADGGKKLTVQGIDATKIVGGANKFKALNVTGAVIVDGTTGGGGHKLDLTNAANVLNVTKGALFTDNSGTSGSIATINVGEAGVPANAATHVLDISTAGAGPINLLSDADPANVLSLLNANSVFTLQTTGAGADQIVVFKNHVVGTAGGGGTVNLRSDNANTLTLQGAAGVQLGVNGLSEINIAGKVTIGGDYGANTALQVASSNVLNVYNGALLTDNSGTSGVAKAINIGLEDPVVVGGVGKAAYLLDVSTFAVEKPGTAINILAAGAGNVLTFSDPAATFTVQNIAAADQTIVFQNHVNGINNGLGDGGGIVNLSSTGGNTLTVSGNTGAEQFGNGYNLAVLNIAGKVTVTGDPGNKLDVSRSDVLNIANDTVFIDKSGTSGSIPQIKVGDANGAAQYTLDVSTAGVSTSLLGVEPLNVLTIQDVNSVVTIQNTAAADKKVVFLNNVVANANGDGIVNLINTDANGRLIVSGENTIKAIIGNSGGNKLAALNIGGGKVTITGNPTADATFNKLDISGTPVLNVYKNAFVTDQSMTSQAIAVINIGADGGGGVGAAVHALDVSFAAGGNADVFTVADTIKFKDAGAAFAIGVEEDNKNITVTLKNNFKGGVDGVGDGGVLALATTGKNSTLIIQSATGAETLGTNANKLQELSINGNVTITGAAGNKVDVSNAATLNVHSGADFTDQSGTSANIAAINIGAGDATLGTLAGEATYVLDAVEGDINIPVGTAINFVHKKGQLSLSNTSAADRTITLNQAIVPNVANEGTIILNSAVVDKKLTIAAGVKGITLGTKAIPLDGLRFTGAGDFDYSGIGIFTTDLEYGVPNAKAGAVQANVSFVYDTNLNQSGIVTGYFDLKGKDPVITMQDGAVITGGVQNTGGAADGNGSIEFVKGGAINAPITGLKLLKLGAGAVTLGAGDNKITEIQGTGTETLTLPAGFNLEGAFNQNGGSALPIVFNGGSVSGDLGTEANRLGAIIANGDNSFNGAVFTSGITTSGGPNIFAAAIDNQGDINTSGNTTFSGDFNNTGNVNLSGNTDFNAAFNNTGNVEIADGSITNFVGAVINKNGNFTTNGGTIFENSFDNTGNLSTLGNTQFKQTFQNIGDLNLGGATTFGSTFENSGNVTINDGSTTEFVGVVTNSNGNFTVAGVATFKDVYNGNGGKFTAVAQAPQIVGNNTIYNIVFKKKFTNTDAVELTNVEFEDAVEVNGNFSALGGTFAKSVTSIGVAELTGNYFQSTFNNQGNITLQGGNIFDDSFTNVGNAVFNKANQFYSTFNNQGDVTLTQGARNDFHNTVTANNIEIQNAIIYIQNTLAFNSNLTGSGATINLLDKRMAYTGEANFTNELNLMTMYTLASNAGGNIVVKSGSKMDLSNVSALNVIVNAANLDINNVGTPFELIKAEAEGGLVPVAADKVTLTVDNQQNRFIKITLDPSSLTLFTKDATEETIEEEINDPNSPISEALANDPDTDVEEVKETLTFLAKAPKASDAGQVARTVVGLLNPEQTIEFIEHLNPDIERPSEAAANVSTQVVGANVFSAISSINTRMDAQQAKQIAIAAGDEDESARLGIWASPFVGNATQKMRNHVNGYKANSNGATIGFDSFVGDNALLGVAYTRADTKIKQRDNKIGDYSKVKSNIYSIYGLYNLLDNNWFFEGIGSYGDSSVKNSSRRIIAVAKNTIGYQTAVSKSKSRSYTGQVMVGYSHLMDEAFAVTPTAGVRYSNVNDKGYQETGTTYQNLIVKGKKYNALDGLAGVKLSKVINTGHMSLTPELYGMVNYNFKGKTPAIDARLQGMDNPLPTNSFKSVKTNFNVGGGLTAKYNMMEYGINYDANIAKKYFAQQGSLKVRVNL